VLATTLIMPQIVEGPEVALAASKTRRPGFAPRGPGLEGTAFMPLPCQLDRFCRRIGTSVCRKIGTAAARCETGWRRGRDSNPRYALRAYNGLANRRLQPLGHLSGALDMPQGFGLGKPAGPRTAALKPPAVRGNRPSSGAGRRPARPWATNSRACARARRRAGVASDRPPAAHRIRPARKSRQS
jgi:hypothetical protein